MRSLLDLIQEYAELGEAKTVARGALPSELERRWAELKHFYDMLMAQDGLAREPAARHTASEIRERVASRSRLRVETDLEIVVAHGGDFYRARVGNLSCGGVLLYCDQPFEVGDELVIHISNVTRGESVLPTEGRVVWRHDRGSSNGTFRYRSGIQFLNLGPTEQRKLDSLVVDSLETKLLCLGRESLDPDFVRREHLAL
jgi:Tfp pilus assembly protein PilZ